MLWGLKNTTFKNKKVAKVRRNCHLPEVRMVPQIHYCADQIKYNIKMNQIDQSQEYAFMQNQLDIS